jgi:hypothetical protein
VQILRKIDKRGVIGTRIVLKAEGEIIPDAIREQTPHFDEQKSLEPSEFVKVPR